MSRQKLGQHFLFSLTWRQRIAQTLSAAPNSTWIEIGAGHGEMTEFLASHAHRVIAIETDPALAASLRTRFAAQRNIEIVKSDILARDLPELLNAPEQHPTQANEQSSSVGHGFNRDRNTGLLSGALAPQGHTEADSSKRARVCVYGNLPYYISSPILTHLFRFATQIESIHVVIQWEVAQRIVAMPGHREYAYLSALCQYFTRPEIVLRIPPGAFRPPPKVHSALVTMQLPGERAHLSLASDKSFLEFLQHSFAQKRKTLRNNLKSIFTDDQIAAALTASKLTANARAEELSLHQFAELFRSLNAAR